MERKKYYSDGVTEATSPLIMTRCECGYEFWRLLERMTCTCRKCGKVLRWEGGEGGEKPPMNLD